MVTLAIMLLDLCVWFFLALTAYRLVRAILMRISFMRRLKAICKDKQYTLKKLRSPLASVFYKSDKIDLIVDTNDTVYNVKFISSLSRKKVYHFVDETNYITYLKLYFALPMATKFNESILFLSYHRFPWVEKKEADNEKYVMLFNPVPNSITYIATDGARHTLDNGEMLGDFVVYNGKGFFSFLKDE